MNAENEIESLSFPSDETFESEWNFFVEHRAHPARIRIALALLSPRDQCLRADVKLSLVTTHGGKSIKEVQLNDHMFFLGKGDSTCSYINDRISPKVVLDLESDSYHEIMSTMREGNSSRTEDYTILANVRFLNEFEIQPRGKMIEFTRRFNADWKLNKFQRIIEEISQTRPPCKVERKTRELSFDFERSTFVSFCFSHERPTFLLGVVSFFSHENRRHGQNEEMESFDQIRQRFVGKLFERSRFHVEK